MIATSDSEIETLTLKMVGTVSILQVIAVKPMRGERIRDALRRAMHRALCAHFLRAGIQLDLEQSGCGHSYYRGGALRLV